MEAKGGVINTSFRCAERGAPTTRGFIVSEKALSERVKAMLSAYKANNRSALFRSGSSEQFKSQCWDLLGKIADARQGADEDAAAARAKREKKEEEHRAKRANVASKLLSLKDPAVLPRPPLPAPVGSETADDVVTDTTHAAAVGKC